MNCNSGGWKPLINDKCLPLWLPRSPDERELSIARRIDATQISKLKDFWNDQNNDVSFHNLDESEQNDFILEYQLYLF